MRQIKWNEYTIRYNDEDNKWETMYDKHLRVTAKSLCGLKWIIAKLENEAHDTMKKDKYKNNNYDMEICGVCHGHPDTYAGTGLANKPIICPNCKDSSRPGYILIPKISELVFRPDEIGGV